LIIAHPGRGCSTTLPRKVQIKVVLVGFIVEELCLKKGRKSLHKRVEFVFLCYFCMSKSMIYGGCFQFPEVITSLMLVCRQINIMRSKITVQFVAIVNQEEVLILCLMMCQILATPP
jgi:hypothetical protein